MKKGRNVLAAGGAPVGKKAGRGSARSQSLVTEELAQLREDLREARETLDALRNGEVDALVVSGNSGAQVYSLTGADQPYRVYIERMQEGAVTVSSEGMILYANQLFAEMVGLPLEQVISGRLSHHVSEEVWQLLSQVFQPGTEVMKHECLILRPGAADLPVNLTACQLPLEDQTIMCLVVTDLTHQKAAELMRLAKESAEQASEAKDAFLAALSHELRTPLTPALMATMALEQDATLPETVRKTLSMIRRNVELEARLIDDLLDLTRITKGKLELHMRPVDVHDLIHRALEICMPDIESHHLHLHLDLAATETNSFGDGVRLQQALWNVIRNAIKFTQSEGSIHIRTGNDLRQEAQPPNLDLIGLAKPGNVCHPGGNIWIQVQDTGVGFSPKTAATLFNAFEQGGREITRRFGGLGLGLAISRTIVQSHGGSLRGESIGPGLGATFTLELPLSSPGEKAAASNGKDFVAKDGGAKGGGHRTDRPLNILMVEDHEDTRTSLAAMLRRSGHEVTAVGTAQAALVAAKDITFSPHGSKFDLVISDLGLPDMSGTDLMRQLRDGYHLPGIAVSGFGMEEDIQRSLASGFSHHLTKPVRMDHLRALLESVELGVK